MLKFCDESYDFSVTSKYTQTHAVDLMFFQGPTDDNLFGFCETTQTQTYLACFQLWCLQLGWNNFYSDMVEQIIVSEHLPISTDLATNFNFQSETMFAWSR